MMAASISENEWQTRRLRIDPKQRVTGWSICDHQDQPSEHSHPPWALSEFSTAKGPADSALWAGGRLLTIPNDHPHEQETEIDRIVRQFTNQDLDAGWLKIRVKSTTPDGLVHVFNSVIGPVSGDPIFETVTLGQQPVPIRKVWMGAAWFPRRKRAIFR